MKPLKEYAITLLFVASSALFYSAITTISAYCEHQRDVVSWVLVTLLLANINIYVGGLIYLIHHNQE